MYTNLKCGIAYRIHAQYDTDTNFTVYIDV